MKQKDIPPEVAVFKMSRWVSADRYEYMINTYPEWFKEEVDYREKWALVPEEVKDNYNNEYWDTNTRIRDEEFKSFKTPEGFNGCGIMTWIELYEDEYHDAMKRDSIVTERMKEVSKKLHNKYYKKYGIKYKD